MNQVDTEGLDCVAFCKWFVSLGFLMRFLLWRTNQQNSTLQLPKPIWPNLLRELCGGCLYISYKCPRTPVATFGQLHGGLPVLKIN